jgi:hypothetical protein
MVVFGRPEPPQSLSPGPPPTLPVPPGQDDAATIVAKYGKFHVGWVVVYGDGRVIQMRDMRSNCSRDTSPPRASTSFAPEPSSRWHSCRCKTGCGTAHPTASRSHETRRKCGRMLRPSRTCPPGMRPVWGSRGTPTHRQQRWWAGFRPRLGRCCATRNYGAYGNDLFSLSEVGPPDHSADTLPPDPPEECFEVSTAEAIVLFKTLRQAGFAFGWVIGDHDEGIRPAPPPPWAGAVRGPCGGVEQPAAVEVCFMPLLPHRQWYDMPG